MANDFQKKGLTKKSENISDWYHDVVLRAGLAEYSDVKGCMIIKPNGYALWEKTQAVLDGWFKEYGVENAYFPIFIKMSLFEKEKEHVEGFAPELAVVTHGGGEELGEPLAVRPTSEAVITQKFADWIQSHRDLPMKLNQWCNVVRWEKRTYPFLRTSEFLWQEGHTVHADKEDAMRMVVTALEWYAKFYREHFAISPYVGIKSKAETFPGAEETYATEIVVPDGKALQAATSHHLGQNFTKAFGVEFLDEAGNKQNPYQTSWGLSTRAIGALVLVHGDDAGLIVPPQVARHQVVVIPLSDADTKTQSDLESYADKIATELKEKNVRVTVDHNFQHSLGYRINEWELQGVPIRLEIGKKELAEETVTAVRRDTFEKKKLLTENVAGEVASMLTVIQTDLLERSEKSKNDLTVSATSYDQFKDIMQNRRSFIRVLWCEKPDCEAKIKEETRATSRVLELEHMNDKHGGTCFACGESADREWLFAQAY